MGTLYAVPTDTLLSYWDFEGNINDQAAAGATADDGTWVGATSFGTGKHGQAIVLDGSNYVSVPNSADVERAGGDLSVSTWFRVDSFDKNWQCLVASGEGQRWRVARHSTNDALSYAGGSGDIFGGSVNDGQWHHVVAISEAGVTTRLFIDGVEVATGGGPGIATSASPMMIGNNPDSATRQWNGAIDDLGIFSNALNEHQVAAIYNLSNDPELGYHYNLEQVNQLIAIHACGPGSTTTVVDTNWEYAASDPADGRDFIQLATDGSGMAGSTGPGILSFAVDHPLIPTGNPLTLSWEVTSSPTTLTIDHSIGDILPLTAAGVGSITLNPGPLTNTTYTLTATNADGTNTRSVEVDVTPNPIIESFTATDTIIPPDTEITLNWSVLNSDSLSLNGVDVTGTTELTLTAATTTTYTLLATNAQGSTTAEVLVTVIIPGEPIISEFSADNDGSLLDEDGDPSDWIEIHNPSASTAIINDYYLTDDPDNLTKWRLPTTTLDETDHLVIFASGKDRAVEGSELHANFSLRGSGEYLALTKQGPAGIIILSEFNPYPSQFSGYSYGVNPDGTTLGYYTNPTPGGSNGTGLQDYVRDTTFSVDRGFYDAPFDLLIESNTVGAQIRYTLDGSDPTPTQGTLYSGPINIATTSVVKAIAFKSGFIPTNVDAQSYLFLDDVLNQPDAPAGYPAGTDFGMDPDVVNDPSYSSTIKDDLKSIPTLSMSMPISSLFGGSGIYTNSNSSGVNWERAGSVEFIYPDGSPDKQVNCGVRMQGGVGRNASFPKHSFRLLFKRQYGDTKLRFPLFRDATEDAEGAVDTFDSIILRAGFNNTWHRGSSAEENRAQYIRDQFIHNSQLAMEHASCHGTFFHLYLNGLYWGVYNAVERPNADFGSSYYGGDKEGWDALNSYPRNVVDGTATDWLQAHAIAQGGVADQAGYDALAEYVDMPNLIDYMMLNFYGGNLDWDDHNWYSINPRVDRGGYKFVCWDAERTLENITGDNRTGVGQDNKPSRLYSQLRANPEFRLQFGDSAHKHLFNGGALTQENTVARYQALADVLDRAIVGESARWGDSKRANPYTRDVEWVAERDRILNSYLPQRTDVTINQLRGANLYPSTDAPVFSQHGGHVLSTTELTMSNTSGTIYYTTDGSDPRLPGGTLNPNAREYDGSISTSTLVAAGSVWKYLDDGSDQGTAWRESTFDDSSWAAGAAELGYGDGAETTTVSFGPNDQLKYRTTYFRREFNVDAPSEFSSLSLELQRDDGAIVYLNGKLVMSSNMPTSGVNYTTAASGVASGGDETSFFNQSVDVADLLPGTNTLAVEVHQVSDTSSDISFDLRLRGSQSNAVDPFLMTESGMLRARAQDGADWSALNEAFFFVDTALASDANLVISEINYRPLPPSPTEEAAGFNERSDFEFIELTNIAASDIDLTNVKFTSGISFNFSDSALGVILPAGERILLVNNLVAFTSRYPDVPPSLIAGEFSGSLSNDGEAIELLAGDNTPIRSFTYNDQAPWPTSADGDGFSLVLIRPASNPDHADPTNWRASIAANGNPGDTDATTFPGPDALADLDRDGTSALLEYASASSDTVANDSTLPSASISLADLGAGEVKTLSFVFTKNITAEDLRYLVQLSNDLINWDTDPAEILHSSSINNGDGTSTETYLLANPLFENQKKFIRLNVSQR
ncbi:CotH kinase family protein [Akkermansiaceae bacterium]|nr:CotH kinase family protein [Akkermansiaceae bacterium]MDB4544313.1 CotH kinase family protein [Akkermansiaceae bacterium]